MIKTICAFALGKDVNFNERVNFIETNMFLDFNKNVKEYGFKLYNKIDLILNNINTITFVMFSDSILNGIVGFKLKDSNCIVKKEFKLNMGQTTINVTVPKLSGEISEVIFYFPKNSNKYAADGSIPCIRFEKIELD